MNGTVLADVCRQMQTDGRRCDADVTQLPDAAASSDSRVITTFSTMSIYRSRK